MRHFRKIRCAGHTRQQSATPTMPHTLPRRLAPFFQTLHGQTVTLALSGGLDSMVLLHLLLHARREHGFALAAAHVHHGLSANADAWADFCRDFCAAHDVPFALEKVRVLNRGEGVEAAARKARYAALARLSHGCLALAHHADDQRETYLLAVLRGGGVRALAAMPAEVSGSLRVVRPLLDVSRAELAAYARAHAVPHIEDESNADPRFLRNWLRRDWLPAAAQRLPHLPQQLDAAVRAARDELALLDEFTRHDREQVCAAGFFDCLHWRELSELRRRNLLYDFAKQHGLGTPARAAVAAFADTLAAAPARHAEWTLPHGWAVAHRGRLLPLPRRQTEAAAWQHGITDTADDIAAVCGITWQHGGGFNTQLRRQSCLIRPTTAGDTLTVRGTRKRTSKLLYEHGVPPRLRRTWPVLCAADGTRCLALIGIAVCDSAADPNGHMPHLPDWAKFITR